MATTPESGKITIEDIPYGDYTYQEIEAPPYFQRDDTIYNLTINGGDELTHTRENYRIPGSITVKKTDEAGNVLSGVTYYIPNLKLAEQPDKPIGKYGRMRRRYLKEYRTALYSSLLLSGKLYSHLLEIDEAANERMEILMPQLMKAVGVTEELKAADKMTWVGLANACKVQAEELV